ncbi:MAG: type II secretion system F family protein [Sedimentisphaerales bacterium]|nr:type II secretion system F family protein [Sedimentisphaerales bacterium]
MLIALMIILVIGCGIAAYYFRPVLGFITGVVLSAGALFCGIEFDIVELSSTAPFIFFLTMLIIAFRQPREGARCPRIWARWILMVISFIGLGIFSVTVFGPAGPYGFVFFLMFTGAVIGAIATTEFSRAAYVITTIGSSIRQNLPLPMALEMAASGLSDKRESILRDIKKWLVEGYSLSESLRRGYPRCPGYAIALIAAGERIGQLPQAIAALEQDLAAKAFTNKKIRPVPLMYPPLVMVFLLIILLFLMTLVIPKFSEVLWEMCEVPLPVATQVLIEMTKFFRSDAAIITGLILIILLQAGAGLYIRVRTRPRRPEKPYLTSRIGDYLKWHIPFLRFYEWSRSMQQVAGMLRLSLNAGCTVNEAIKNTLMLDVNGCFRRRLKQWLLMVERGDDIGQSAGRCGLGSGMTWAFPSTSLRTSSDAGNRGNTMNILDTLETSYRWAYSRAAGLARVIIGPCETVAMGLMVGFVMYAVFVPIVTIIVAVGSSIS